MKRVTILYYNGDDKNKLMKQLECLLPKVIKKEEMTVDFLPIDEVYELAGNIDLVLLDPVIRAYQAGVRGLSIAQRVEILDFVAYASLDTEKIIEQIQNLLAEWYYQPRNRGRKIPARFANLLPNKKAASAV